MRTVSVAALLLGLAVALAGQHVAGESVEDIFDTVRERLNDPSNTPDAIDSVVQLVSGIKNRLTNEQLSATRTYQSSVMETTGEREKLREQKDQAKQDRLNFEASLLVMRQNVSSLQNDLDTLDDRIKVHADALGELDVKLDKAKMQRRVEMLRFVRRKKHTMISLARIDKVIDLLGFEKPKAEEEKTLTLKQKLDIEHQAKSSGPNIVNATKTGNATQNASATEEEIAQSFIQLNAQLAAGADDLENLRVLLLQLNSLLHQYVRDLMETESAAEQVFKNRRIVWEEKQHEHRQEIEKLEGSRMPTQQKIAKLQKQIAEIDPFKISQLTRRISDLQTHINSKDDVLKSLREQYQAQKQQRDDQLTTVEQMEAQLASHRGLRPNFYNAAAKNGSTILS